MDHTLVRYKTEHFEQSALTSVLKNWSKKRVIKRNFEITFWIQKRNPRPRAR